MVKPARFEYFRPTSMAEALGQLAQHPEESKILAGGQSLIPMMNFRLARPSRLIDINDVPQLGRIQRDDSQLVIGARARHLALQNHSGPDPLARLLRTAAAQIGHLPIRTRGTFGGSLAHADAVSEWCLIARLLDARITVQSQRGRRVLDAADFFQSIFTTAMDPDELLVSVALENLDDSHRVGFVEYARRAGDFAIVAVATDIVIVDGKVSKARICIGGVDNTPFRSEATERELIGAEWPAEPVGSDLVTHVAEELARIVTPPSDGHADAAYRRDLVRALSARALSTDNLRMGMK